MKIQFEGTQEEFEALFGVRVPAKEPAKTLPTASTPWPPTATGAAWSAIKPTSWNDPDTLPADYGVAPAIPDTAVSEELRQEAINYFGDMINLWTQGWDPEKNAPDPEVDQPDRVQIMQALGNSRYAYPLLKMAYEVGSLQELVWRILPHWTSDQIYMLSGNLVQVSIAGFPDLAGTLDHTKRWIRNHKQEAA